VSAPANDILWRPSADWRDSTLIGELCQRLDVPDYDALLALSLRSPDTYWRAAWQHLGFAWREAPAGHVDLAQGPALPKWFPGARLNWVDSVLAHAEGPRSVQAAVIGESEDCELRSLSYAELAVSVRTMAGGLQQLGVRTGDRVGLMMAMNASAVTALLAIAAIGAVAVPLFSGFGADAAAARLQLAGARWLLASQVLQRRGRRVDLAPVLREVQQRLPALQLVVDGDPAACGGMALGWPRLQAAPLAELPAFGADQPFMIVFTSGTTGAPKGTVHTHGGFPLKILHDCAYHFDLRAGDRWLWPSDMGWIVGPITTVGALGRGATLVCYDGAPDQPDAGRLARTIDRHRVTHFGASPTLVRLLAAAPAACDNATLESLRLLMLAGEVIDSAHFEWFFRNFGRGRLPVINYSGGTEASGALVANVLARPIRPCAFNSASPSIDLFAADAQGQRVRRVAGELVIAAPFVGMTAGFWEARERYLDTYWSQHPGLWIHGDLLLEDEDGQFFILGRSDDTLKIAGKRVGPAEVEAIVLACATVQDVAAVSLPHPVKGEQLVICATTHTPPTASLAEEVAAHIETALGKPFRPARVHFVQALPRTRNGKVMRRVVRDMLRGMPSGDTTALENPEALEALHALSKG
jgi:acetyl-CoA synthetase